MLWETEGEKRGEGRTNGGKSYGRLKKKKGERERRWEGVVEYSGANREGKWKQ